MSIRSLRRAKASRLSGNQGSCESASTAAKQANAASAQRPDLTRAEWIASAGANSTLNHFSAASTAAADHDRTNRPVCTPIRTAIVRPSSRHLSSANPVQASSSSGLKP